jgi:thiol-disulfide isomerase/thioredoxin
MLLIALGGSSVSQRMRRRAAQLRTVSGVVIAAVAFAFVFHLDDRLTGIAPGYLRFFQSHVENSKTAQGDLAKLRGGKTAKESSGVSLQNYGAAPGFYANGDWFNSRPLTVQSLRGKVVLVDFWTYSCINCLRTLPHLEAWYAKYHKDGLVIVGVHTPEFAFEHVSSNVAAAIKRLGIKYPVFQDNDYRTWSAWGNQYWPAEFVIDRKGDVRHAHFGEGEYGQTEQVIRKLLGITSGAMTDIPNLTPTELMTPESYLGYLRLDRYVGSKVKDNRATTYTLPKQIPQNDLAYGGTWTIGPQRILAGKNASIALHFHAKDVYIVLGGHGHVDVTIGGKPAAPLDVDAFKLYTVRSSNTVADATVALRFTPGVAAYSFTFG